MKQDQMFCDKPFFLRSGFPFFTVAITMSPQPAAGRRFSLPRIPWTEMMYRFLAPKFKQPKAHCAN